MTLLTTIQTVCDEVGLSRPSAVISATDRTTVELRSFANEIGADIARRGDWSRLSATLTLATLANATALPANYLRLAKGGAVSFTSGAKKPIRGPVTTEQLAFLRSLSSTAELYFGIDQGQVALSRALVAGETVEARYIKNEWVVGVGSAFASDNDLVAFPERLMVKGILWRWRREKGMQYSDHLAEWEAEVSFELGQDRGVT